MNGFIKALIQLADAHLTSEYTMLQHRKDMTIKYHLREGKKIIKNSKIKAFSPFCETPTRTH